MSSSINAATLPCSPAELGGAHATVGIHVERTTLAPAGFWGVVRSRYGNCVVAGSGVSLTWLSIGTTAAPAPWVRQLHGGLLPRADKAAQTLLQASCAALQAGDDLHLHVRGTDFRLAVWRGLLTIPPGECLSYGELAQQLGRPGAARAVGSAAAANAIAGFIPCHRLVPASGGVGAYRWGSALKATILAAERASGGSCTNTLL